MPRQLTDFAYRIVVADNEMIRDSWIMNNGVGVPYVFGLSDGHQRIICRVDMSEKDLPKSHDELTRVPVKAPLRRGFSSWTERDPRRGGRLFKKFAM